MCALVNKTLCNIFYRSASLQHVNNMLREQLEQATSANQQLTLDIQKLTADWNKAREELEARDEEEQAYFANEHVRLMDMWKTMNNFRRQFNEMKSATQRFVCERHSETMKLQSKPFLYLLHKQTNEFICGIIIDFILCFNNLLLR